MGGKWQQTVCTITTNNFKVSVPVAKKIYQCNILSFSLEANGK